MKTTTYEDELLHEHLSPVCSSVSLYPCPSVFLLSLLITPPNRRAPVSTAFQIARRQDFRLTHPVFPRADAYIQLENRV